MNDAAQRQVAAASTLCIQKGALTTAIGCFSTWSDDRFGRTQAAVFDRHYPTQISRSVGNFLELDEH